MVGQSLSEETNTKIKKLGSAGNVRLKLLEMIGHVHRGAPDDLRQIVALTLEKFPECGRGGVRHIIGGFRGDHLGK